MSREFDGSDDILEFAAGSIGGGFNSGAHGWTLLCVVKPLSFVGTNCIICFGAGGGGALASIYTPSDGEIRIGTDNPGFNGLSTLHLTTNEWQFVAITQAAGGGTPRMHRSVVGSGSWQHANNTTGTFGIGGGDAGGMVNYFGRFRNFAGSVNMRYATAAYFPRGLADAELEALGTSTYSIYTATGGLPTALWDFNQASVADGLADLIGDADEVSRVGTSVSGDDPAGWTYGLAGGGNGNGEGGVANYTLTTSTFPNGTNVGAYPVSRWREDQQPPSGAPIGTAVATATSNGSQVAFTGLAEGTDYYASAQVGGTDRYVRFSVDPPTGPPTDPHILALAGAYVPVFASATRITTSAVTATKYLVLQNLADQTTAAAITALNTSFAQIFNWLATDHTAPPGMATKLRVAAAVGVAGNAAATYTVGLYPITISAGNIVAGTVVSGSEKAIVVGGPQAQSLVAGVGTDFTPPTDGAYLLGLTVSAIPTAAVNVFARVARRFV